MAKEMLEALPLGRQHLMSVELVPLVRLPPCANCSRHTRNRGRMPANARTGQPFHLGDMTMKVLCISKWAKAPSPEERDAILPKEVPATLKLYLDGVIEQMWFKLDAPGVVFLVNAESVDAAKTHVHGLPMGQAGLMDFDFIPIAPLAPLGMLIAEK
jgi:hypothetical protein